MHLKLIRAEFESSPLGSVRPSQIREWLARLSDEGYAASTLYAVHARLSQLMADAVHDRLISENPCSRRTSQGVGSQRLYVATTDQVWDLYERLPERRRLSVLLGAFAGLTTGEVCGLRVANVAFLEREIRPAVQSHLWPDSDESTRTAVEQVLSQRLVESSLNRRASR